MEPLLSVESIHCSYGGGPVVDGLSLSLPEGELACLLGPSGCGKTTVLRAIAGFEPLVEGEIRLAGRSVSRPGYMLAPEKRKLGMVFQDYALFPHMRVNENVAFGLSGAGQGARRRTVEEMLEAVGLDGLGERFPHELSGGQQQRVALARALAPHPHIILMDEPFSNLDVDLRERVSSEVREILKQQGITGILVTHDQHEAFALGDRIGVMHEGRILQWDSAAALYHEPETRFVADFIGQGVFVNGTVVDQNSVQTELGVVCGRPKFQVKPGQRVELLLRPDDIVPSQDGALDAEIIQRAFKGAEILYTLRVSENIVLLAMFPSHLDYPVGARVGIDIATDHLVAFPG